jgi:thiamine kinase-like enzyme
LLEHDVASIERIGGGRNSQVYRVTYENCEQYAAKFYFRHGLDARNRLKVEFSSLQFLWENGIRYTPQPIIADMERGWAVYEYIEGEKISSSEITDSDIDYAVQFLARLRKLKTVSGSEYLPAASEACFSVRTIVDNIGQRLDRLSAVEHEAVVSSHATETQYRSLREFLTDHFVPSFDEITKWCKSALNQAEMPFESALPDESRSFSPSDFGFHNALRCSDGKIVFLDFEYFGWDDPAKIVSDFLLHPAMELNESLKRRFVIGILTCFEDDKYLKKRIEIVYPLFALKWCMIFLNEFVPEHLLRRGFASEDDMDINDLRARQLLKARQMLEKTMNKYQIVIQGGKSWVNC